MLSFRTIHLFKIKNLKSIISMKKHFKTFGIFALCIFAASACKRAGTDGDATLVVFPQHHGRTIPNHTGYPDSVYVKFNAQELPTNPTQNFDVVFVGEVGEDHVHCEHLHTGNYFLYATGWDTDRKSVM